MTPADRPIGFDELDTMAEIIRLDGTNPGGRWAAYQGRYLALPAWFDPNLDPDSAPYRQQQARLWQAIVGTAQSYDAQRDEQATEIEGFDALRFPAFYSRRDIAALSSAADHLIALGHMVQLCGLHAGDVAIEYGAGFGQMALTLARLGVQVYAIDINPMFNAAVQAQADFFGVALRAVHGTFGDNPQPGQQYDAVLFYEAFHHCADPARLVGRLRELVKPGGVVLMAGEPIVVGGRSVPYPWGVRLDAESAAVVRWRHWYELGFQEDYLVGMFIASGFVWTKHPCPLTHYGEAHAFRLRPSRIAMSAYAFPAAETAGWFAPEPTGRWTASRAILPIDASGGHTHIRLSLANYLPGGVSCTLSCGEEVAIFGLESQRHTTVTLACVPGTRTVEITCADVQVPSPQDGRMLGIFLRWFEYVSTPPGSLA